MTTLILKLILDAKTYLFYSLLQYQGSNDSVVRAFRTPSFKFWLNLNVVSYAVTSIVRHYNTLRHALKLHKAQA